MGFGSAMVRSGVAAAVNKAAEITYRRRGIIRRSFLRRNLAILRCEKNSSKSTRAFAAPLPQFATDLNGRLVAAAPSLRFASWPSRAIERALRLA
jgi:hypothetical protein